MITTKYMVYNEVTKIKTFSFVYKNQTLGLWGDVL